MEWPVFIIERHHIDYWVDLCAEEFGTYGDIDRLKKMLYTMADQQILLAFDGDGTGLFCYIISDDFKGNDIFSEVLFIIRKENRGSLKLVKQYINKAEELARENNCLSIKIGGNIGYKDDGFIKLLKRWGYVDDTVSKKVG